MATTTANLSDYQHISSGKVRELYRVDADHLLMVASDRISAYDHILPSEIPDKGRILTAMSAFWFELLADVVQNHVVAITEDPRIPVSVLGRAMLVRRLDMIEVECVARGYLSGSGWSGYQAEGAVCGVPLPAGLLESSKLPRPIFTPATKAEFGQHDENVSFEKMSTMVGGARAEELRLATLAVYARAADYSANRGVLLADTKFEFGIDPVTGSLVLADEVLTPDSSRYWPAAQYQPGGPQLSFDKQYVRDWLTSSESGWDRASDIEPPQLPESVISATRARYVEAYETISGRSFANWPSGS
ncbi:MAG: phosphoribosylaminoimidazolesuccinocarboxamide synthase [Nakamurella sp.]